MSSPTNTGGTGSGRRRGGTKFAAEDQALDQIAREAEMRLAARRAARAEAREIRMRELEKQQKTAEEKQDRHYELTKPDRTTPTVRPYMSSSRRGSDDSGDSGDTREMRKEITDLEEKWRKSMMNNAQLDNEKQTYRYQVDMLKDTLEEMEEQLIELQREHKDRCRELEAQKRNYKDLNIECTMMKEQLQLRDKLIEENGLVFVSDEIPEEDNQKGGAKKDKKETQAALVTPEAANLLALAEGSLDDRLKSFASEKEQLDEEVRKLKQQLEEERERGALAEKYASPKPTRGSNGPDMQLLEVQMEAQRQLNDYKFKLKKCEQDITQLEGNVIRLESQVKRYKAAAENSEKVEEELKLEKRKLQRELRETQNTAEELQTANHHLQKRLEKIKSTRNALNKP